MNEASGEINRIIIEPRTDPLNAHPLLLRVIYDRLFKGEGFDSLEEEKWTRRNIFAIIEIAPFS